MLHWLSWSFCSAAFTKGSLRNCFIFTWLQRPAKTLYEEDMTCHELEVKSSSRLNTSPGHPLFYILMTFAQNWGASWEEPAWGPREPQIFEDTEIKGMRQKNSRVSRRACKSYGFSFPVMAETVAPQRADLTIWNHTSVILAALLLRNSLSSQQPPQTTGLAWGSTTAGVTLCFMLALMSPLSSSVILCARWSWSARHQTHRLPVLSCLGAPQDSHPFHVGPLRGRMKQ